MLFVRFVCLDNLEFEFVGCDWYFQLDFERIRLNYCLVQFKDFMVVIIVLDFEFENLFGFDAPLCELNLQWKHLLIELDF